MLRNMRRGYTNDDYRSRVEKIRNRVPGVSLGTDLIVGFCGETDAQFQQTYDMVKDIRFDKVHAAAYSTREGTIAARTMEDDVPREEKKARLKAIEELQAEVQTEINSGLDGTVVDVLIEGTKRGRAEGRNRNDKLVHMEDGQDLIGEVVNARIDKTGPWSLLGTLVSPQRVAEEDEWQR